MSASAEYHKRWRLKNPEKWRAIKRRCNQKNRLKYNATERAWRTRNKDKIAQYGHKRNIRQYGVTPVDYTRMLAEQGNCCALCYRDAALFKRKLHVDHDHETGQVRALLCHDCNTGIGLFQESSERLRAAIYYLETHKGRD